MEIQFIIEGFAFDHLQRLTTVQTKDPPLMPVAHVSHVKMNSAASLGPNISQRRVQAARGRPPSTQQSTSRIEFAMCARPLKLACLIPPNKCESEVVNWWSPDQASEVV